MSVLFTVREPCSSENEIRIATVRFYSYTPINRLEVCFNGYWGSVCGDHKTTNTVAEVACRELNYAAKGYNNIMCSMINIILKFQGMCFWRVTTEILDYFLLCLLFGIDLCALAVRTPY